MMLSIISGKIIFPVHLCGFSLAANFGFFRQINFKWPISKWRNLDIKSTKWQSRLLNGRYTGTKQYDDENLSF